MGTYRQLDPNEMNQLARAMKDTLSDHFREAVEQKSIEKIHEAAQLAFDAGFFLDDISMLPSVRRFVQEKLKETGWEPEQWTMQ